MRYLILMDISVRGFPVEYDYELYIWPDRRKQNKKQSERGIKTKNRRRETEMTIKIYLKHSLNHLNHLLHVICFH